MRANWVKRSLWILATILCLSCLAGTAMAYPGGSEIVGTPAQSAQK